LTTPSSATERPQLQVKPLPVGDKAFVGDPLTSIRYKIVETAGKLGEKATRELIDELNKLNVDFAEALDALDGGGKGACRT